MKNNKSLKIMAAAIYEIRCQLSAYLGSKQDVPTEIRLAAHLAYALHNEALMIMDGADSFDILSARKKVRGAERFVGSNYVDRNGVMLTEDRSMDQ